MTKQFAAEERALAKAQKILREGSAEEREAALRDLAEDYARLLRKTRRLVSLGDIMEDELRRLAARDHLTGLRNRRSLLEAGRGLVESARRSGGCVSVIVFDVDRFKSINDRFGHDAGDEALRRLADVLRDGLRAADAAGRIGGEEFVVVLPDADAEEALAVAERLREAVAGLRLSLDGGELAFTVSAGVCSDASGRLDVEELLKRADAALYEAKRTGRDRCLAFVRDADAGRDGGAAEPTGGNA